MAETFMPSSVQQDKVFNNLTTTAAGYVLDARQGKALSDQITAQKASYSAATGTVDTNGTYQIPNFSTRKVFVVSARRYGYFASAVLHKEIITQGAAQNMILKNTCGDSATGADTKLSISNTGLITVLSTGSPVFIEVASFV